MTAATTATHAAERTSFARSGTPGCSHAAASAAKPPMAATTPETRPTDSSPCSKLRSTCVSDSRPTHSSTPGWPAKAKSKTHEPIVNASVTIAAVAELSEMAAENSAMAPTSRP